MVFCRVDRVHIAYYVIGTVFISRSVFWTHKTSLKGRVAPALPFPAITLLLPQKTSFPSQNLLMDLIHIGERYLILSESPEENKSYQGEAKMWLFGSSPLQEKTVVQLLRRKRVSILAQTIYLLQDIRWGFSFIRCMK